MYDTNYIILRLSLPPFEYLKTFFFFSGSLTGTAITVPLVPESDLTVLLRWSCAIMGRMDHWPLREVLRFGAEKGCRGRSGWRRSSWYWVSYVRYITDMLMIGWFYKLFFEPKTNRPKNSECYSSATATWQSWLENGWSVFVCWLSCLIPNAGIPDDGALGTGG